MLINDLRLDIINNELKHLYFLYGEEVGIRDIYINKIKETLNLPISYIDSFSSIQNKLATKSLFANSYLYIIVDDYDCDINIDPKDNYIVFIYNNIDKRSKLYKKYKDNFIEFNKLTEEELTKYINKKQKELSADNIRDLIYRCDFDYSRIISELEKLSLYNEINGGKVNSTYNEIKNDIYSKPKDAIFDLIDSILTKNINKSFCYLNECENIGESNINILYNLYNNVRQVLQVQTCVTKDIEKSTGLSQFIIQIVRRKCGYYTAIELENILSIIRDVDSKVKAGKIDERYSVRYVLLATFSHI